jgi:monoamine oxidase
VGGVKETDVAVIGAGAAGLAAAAELQRRGLRVAVLEARDRIGGRILTVRAPGVAAPIELGAEFIHGEAPLTERLVAAAGLADYDVTGDHWLAERGHLRRYNGFWKQIDHILDRVDPAAEDQSVAELLAKRPGGRALARGRAATRQFVEGFHAADPEELSVLSIAAEEGEEPTESAERVGRLIEGYDRVPAWLARDLGAAVHLGTAVTEIAWERGRVELTLQSRAGQQTSKALSKLRSRAVVVTLPLGVLQASPDALGGVRFRPDPPRLRKTLDRLAMGSVVRLTLAFHEFPWKRRSDLDRLRYLHTGDPTFRVWWTAYPLRAPVLVAWSGGPAAKALEGRAPAAIEGAALRALAEHLGLSRRRITSRLAGTWCHDWNTDPFSRGAYSYARVGGSEAAKALSRPIEKTLFFAGEAADPEGRTGTVEGAIATGLRAARQAAASLALTSGRRG